jgi:hypothetical protein
MARKPFNVTDAESWPPCTSVTRATTRQAKSAHP